MLIRNPWATNHYHGIWDKNSSKWTAKAKEATNYDQVNLDSGYFFIDWDEYWNRESLTSMNYDTFDWNLDYFLMLDD